MEEDQKSDSTNPPPESQTVDVMPVRSPDVPVDYVAAARRHFSDAEVLANAGSRPNAGQLLGFSVECGLKAILLACGIPADSEGGIPAEVKGAPKYHRFRQHMPGLANSIAAFGHLIPDGPRSAHYVAMLSTLGAMSTWKVDHRYYSEAAIPLASLADWRKAAMEVNQMLDEAIVDGVI